MKRLYTILILILSSCIYAQVGISENTSFTPHEDAALHVEKTDNKAVILPSASNEESALPQYNPSAADLYNDDADLEGAIIFDKEAFNVNEYDGTKWGSVKDFVVDLKTPRLAHFTRSGNPSSTCTRSLITDDTCAEVDINWQGNGTRDFNNLNVSLVGGNGDNEFLIGETGLYRISFKSPAVFNINPAYLLLDPIDRTWTVTVKMYLQTPSDPYVVLYTNSYIDKSGLVRILNIGSLASTPNIQGSTAIHLEAGSKVRLTLDGLKSGYVPLVNPGSIQLINAGTHGIGEIIFEKINL